MRTSGPRALSLGADREKLVAKFNRAHPAPGPLTRVSDRIVDAVARFESRWTREELPEETDGEIRPRSNRAIILGFAFFTIGYSCVFRLDRAPLFFGSLASVAFLSRAWTLWHRAHPPTPDADSKAAGIVPALCHATGALILVLLFGYATKMSLPNPQDFTDFNQLISASSAAAYVYQRRTGWKHADPEIGIIVAAIVVVVSGLWTIGSLIIGRMT